MMNTISNRQQYLLPFSIYFVLCLILFLGSLFFTGCAGPLDTATRRALDTAFVRKTYLTKVYLGNQYNLDYTNNSVEGRGPTGVFIDQALNYWYETDASFFESGSSGHEYSLEQLQEIDRDLDFETFGQGIAPGQLVVVKEISDKSDQVIFEVETVSRYKVTKTYGLSTRSKAKPRASRIHCIFGKEGMRDLDQTVLYRMLDQLFAPVPSLGTDAQKHEFILSHYPNTPLDDLVKLTGFTKRKILEISYTQVLSQGQFAPSLQEKLVEVLVMHHELWSQDPGIRIQDVRVGEGTLVLDCAIQEISNSVIYHSPELRAGLLFFDGVTSLARPFGNALAAILAEDVASSFQKLIITFSYPYFDKHGWRIPENITCTIVAEDLRQFAELTINNQELADRSEILMGTEPMKISLSALEAVKDIRQAGPVTWKVVNVEFEDWDYVEDKNEKVIIIQGEVRNTGTWIAKDVEVIAKGYDKYGFDIRSESTTLYGVLKPGETRSFTIKMNAEDIRRRPRLFLKWKEVE